MKKSKLTLFLCAVLMLSMVLTACGDKTNFLLSLKSAMEMERYAFTATVKANISSVEETEDISFSPGEVEVIMDGFVNDAANGKFNLTVKIASAGTTITQEIGDILVIDNVLYMDLSVMSGLMGGDASMLPEGKTILKLEDFSDMSEEVPASVNTEAVYTSLVNMVTGFADILEKSAKDVSPDVFYKDGEKYCFSLSKDNGATFIKNLGETLKSDSSALYDSIVSALKDSEDEDCKLFAEELESQKGDLLLSINNAADEMLEVTDSDFEGFNLLASSTLTGKEGSRNWALDLDVDMKEDNSFDLDVTMKEYKEAKELSVDQEKVITMEEYTEYLFSFYMSDVESFSDIEDIA